MNDVEFDIKVWEQCPISFASFRDKIMAFCYENNVAPDDLMISPYTEMEYDTIVEMGFRISVIQKET